MHVPDSMATNTDVDAIGKSTSDCDRTRPLDVGHDGGAMFGDGSGSGMAVELGDSAVTETPAARRDGSPCGIAKWSKRAKASSWNDATHNLRTRVNR